MTAYRIDSSTKNYAWGSRSWIADLLGRAPSGEPEAELWLGAHPAGAARLVDPELAERSLRELIDADPALQLGRETSRRFAARLPFLFKVLAAEQPLSLQAHPSLAQARAGFALEEARGVPLEARERKYRDDNHKPELLCALGPFQALAGFRPVAETLEVLGAFGIAEARSPLFDAWRRLRESPDASGLRRFFAATFALPPEAIHRAVDVAIERTQALGSATLLEMNSLPGWFARLAALYPADPGLFIGLLLNLVELEAGQGLFLPAGQLHSYLGGLGLEVMAASDNVLRGGLTPKHVDVPELLEVLDFSPQRPWIVEAKAETTAEGVSRRRFETPAAEFELTLLELSGVATWSGQGPSILLGLEGEATLRCAERELSLARGQQLFCNAEHPFVVQGAARLAAVGVNPHG